MVCLGKNLAINSENDLKLSEDPRLNRAANCYIKRKYRLEEVPGCSIEGKFFPDAGEHVQCCGHYDQFKNRDHFYSFDHVRILYQIFESAPLLELIEKAEIVYRTKFRLRDETEEGYVPRAGQFAHQVRVSSSRTSKKAKLQAKPSGKIEPSDSSFS